MTMTSNYIPGNRFSKGTKGRDIENQILGFKTGVLAMAVTMNDLLDDAVDEDMIGATCEGAMTMMEAIGTGDVKCKYLNRELEKRTGINILGVE